MRGMTSYRYPNETLVFWGTVLLVIAVIVFTSAATICISGLFILGMFVLAYFINRSHHQSLMESALLVNPKNAPQVAQLVTVCRDRLKPGPFDCYIARSNELNAYTFGMEDPKTLVVYSSLLQIMDEDELSFVIGHEMGHIQLGHTWLNTILGGMAGIPASYGAAALLTLVFKSWNRMCEYSADRAGLLVCGRPEKAVSALLKLVSGERHINQNEMNRLLQVVDQQDDSILGQMDELLSDHPMIIKRIQQIRAYAKTDDYASLSQQILARTTHSTNG
jgi:Zn-dependent protease with chaperone function